MRVLLPTNLRQPVLLLLLPLRRWHPQQSVRQLAPLINWRARRQVQPAVEQQATHHHHQQQQQP